MHRDERGGNVIVAIPLRGGERNNSTLRRILERFPMQPGNRVQHRQIGINPMFLLPLKRGYYRYNGSLTYPPCTEGVLWYVFEEPLEVGVSQIARIIHAVGGNARPVQPLNGRTIHAVNKR